MEPPDGSYGKREIVWEGGPIIAGPWKSHWFVRLPSFCHSSFSAINKGSVSPSRVTITGAFSQPAFKKMIYTKINMESENPHLWQKKKYWHFIYSPEN